MAVLVCQGMRSYGDGRVHVAVWTEPETRNDVVLIDLTNTCCPDTYAIARDAEAEYGRHARLILWDGDQLQEMCPTGDTAWTGELISLADLAAQLGVHPREVLPS